jgi:hypothetical protein
MLISFRNVLVPAVALHVNLATQPFVFTPNPDGFFPDSGDTTLRDWWAPYAETGVLQKTPFVSE